MSAFTGQLIIIVACGSSARLGARLRNRPPASLRWCKAGTGPDWDPLVANLFLLFLGMFIDPSRRSSCCADPSACSRGGWHPPAAFRRRHDPQPEYRPADTAARRIAVRFGAHRRLRSFARDTRRAAVHRGQSRRARDRFGVSGDLPLAASAGGSHMINGAAASGALHSGCMTL